MTTNVNIEVQDSLLLEALKARQANARGELLNASDLRRLEPIARESLRLKLAARGLNEDGSPLSGSPLDGSSPQTSNSFGEKNSKKQSTESRIGGQEPAANRFGKVDLVLGWLQEFGGPTRVVSGNGASVVELPIVSSGGTADNRSGWMDYDADYITGYYDWKHWYPNLPGGGYWIRRRAIGSMTLKFRTISSEGADGDLLLPAPGSAIYVLYQQGRFIGVDHTLTASRTTPETNLENERSGPGDIAETVYVVGSPDENPDILIASGTRRRGAELLIIVLPTAIDREVGQLVSSSINSCAVFNDRRARVINTPAALTSKLGNIFGVPRAPSDSESGIIMAGYSLSLGDPPGLGTPFADKRITYQGTELRVSPWSILFADPDPSNRTVPITVTMFGDTPNSVAPAPDKRIDQILDYSVIQNFGFADIDRDPDGRATDASFGGISNATNPFMYRLLDGSYTFTADDIPDSLSELFALLAPIPPKFQMYGVQTLSDPNILSWGDLSSYYRSPTTRIPFLTFRNIPENYRSGGDWYDFADPATGAPNILGQPVRFTKTLAPLAGRVGLTSPNTSVSPLVSTTFGEKSYCLDSLAALGFSAADLTP